MSSILQILTASDPFLDFLEQAHKKKQLVQGSLEHELYVVLQNIMRKQDSRLENSIASGLREKRVNPETFYNKFLEYARGQGGMASAFSEGSMVNVQHFLPTLYGYLSKSKLLGSKFKQFYGKTYSAALGKERESLSSIMSKKFYPSGDVTDFFKKRGSKSPVRHLPDFLIIFTLDFDTEIKAPMNFTFKQSEQIQITEKEKTYELCGVLYYSGNHYISSAKQRDGTWYCYDDHSKREYNLTRKMTREEPELHLAWLPAFKVHGVFYRIKKESSLDKLAGSLKTLKSSLEKLKESLQSLSN